MDKKYKAKRDMLSKLSNSMKDDMYSKDNDLLEKKKKMAVSVEAKDPESLEKGLTMAQKLLKAKFNQSESDEKEEVSEEHSCPMCEDEGCEECEEELEDDAE